MTDLQTARYLDEWIDYCHFLGLYFLALKWYENRYKTLSRREFVDVMKARLQRGLDRQRGIEFTAKLWALGSCACETYAPESVKNVYNLVAEKLESQSKTEDKKVEE